MSVKIKTKHPEGFSTSTTKKFNTTVLNLTVQRNSSTLKYFVL